MLEPKQDSQVGVSGTALWEALSVVSRNLNLTQPLRLQNSISNSSTGSGGCEDSVACPMESTCHHT